jgi:hypothetical protein
LATDSTLAKVGVEGSNPFARSRLQALIGSLEAQQQALLGTELGTVWAAVVSALNLLALGAFMIAGINTVTNSAMDGDNDDSGTRRPDRR